MRGARSAKWVGGAIVIALAATACGGGDSGSDDKNRAIDKNGTFVYASGEPQNPLQPANTKEAYGSDVIHTLFTGLVDYTPGTGKLVNMNAESVTPSKDNKTWTVKLKPGWKFHNGEAVTAKSYVDAWNWAAYTPNNQTNSSWFADIEGYTDVHPEKGKPKTDKMSGLKVKGANEFTITLTTGIPYYAYKLGYEVFSPLPSGFFKDPKGYGEKPVGNGPYKFASWDHKKSIKVTRYDGYQGPNKAKNGGVTFKNYASSEGAYKDLVSNNVDSMNQVPEGELANYQEDLGDRAINQDYSMIQTIAFARYTKQWKNIDVKVLQGLSMAIDRDTIIKTVLNNTREAATGWVAKDVIGYKAGACGEYCKYDPKKAKDLIKAGGGVPDNKVSIQYNADQPHKGWVTAVCNSIKQATGVNCVGDPKTDFQADTQTRDAKKVKSMYRSGWVLDYPFNGNFLRDLYGTGVGGNQSGFSNKDFDKLTAKADKAPTTEKSAELYNEAETSLQNSFPSIPLWYGKLQTGASTNVTGVKFDQQAAPIFTEVQVYKK